MPQTYMASKGNMGTSVEAGFLSQGLLHFHIDSTHSHPLYGIRYFYAEGKKNNP